MRSELFVTKTEVKDFGESIGFECRWCNNRLMVDKNKWGFYQHNCSKAGAMFLMNDYLWLGVPNYITEEKNSVAA